MADSLATFRDNAVELNRSNEELSNFAYVASHDLRSPLRAIRNLVDWTIEDAGDEIPVDVRTNLEMIRDRADRLSRLLSDLLDYARAGRTEAQAKVLHLPGMVRDIADIVDPDHRFEIAFEGDRCLATYETPLRTMLLNLVSNAKKHHDRGSGRVTIAHETSEQRSRIIVADDGPGIPTQYQAKIFDLFQTLKSNDEIEGSGMGLALVKKLATELGGSIRLESKPEAERGCRFIIDIPIVASLTAKTEDDSSLTEGVAA